MPVEGVMTGNNCSTPRFVLVPGIEQEVVSFAAAPALALRVVSAAHVEW